MSEAWKTFLFRSSVGGPKRDSLATPRIPRNSSRKSKHRKLVDLLILRFLILVFLSPNRCAERRYGRQTFKTFPVTGLLRASDRHAKSVSFSIMLIDFFMAAFTERSRGCLTS